MANVEHGAFAFDEDMYIEDGVYSDSTLTGRAAAAQAWQNIKTLLGKHSFSSV